MYLLYLYLIFVACFDLSLICFYSLFEVKDGDDLLDCGEDYTKVDIIIKAYSYIIKGLRKNLRINCK